MKPRKKRLEALGALKIIGVLLLFWWHSPLAIRNFDLGARVCEFMFVSSGFLVAYNRMDKPNAARWRDSLVYLKAKLCAMWPLHLIGFLAWVLLDPESVQGADGAVKAVINIFLLQSWFNDPELFFAFNGVSWFLASILFCYFISPLLLKGLKTTRGAAATFLLVYAARLAVELFELSPYGELARVSIYVFPAIRAAEFYCGMVMYKLCSVLSGRVSRIGKTGAALLFSLAEPAVLAAAVALMISKPDWLRGYFVLVYCFVVPVFSFDKGIISRILSLKIFHVFDSIEYEMFMLHRVMLLFSGIYTPQLLGTDSPWTVSVAALMLTVIAGALYKKLLSRPLAAVMGRILSGFERLSGYSLN